MTTELHIQQMATQEEHGKLLGWQMIPAKVKFFNRSPNPSEHYGFAQVENPEHPDPQKRCIDVFVHGAGGYEWACDGGDSPGLRRGAPIPAKGSLIWLDEIDLNDKGFRSNKWMPVSHTAHERAMEAIAARPVYRMMLKEGNGEPQCLFEGQSTLDLRERFPAHGRNVSFPTGVIENREYYFEVLTVDGFIRCDDPR